MKKGLSVFVVAVAAVVCTLSANAQYYVAGDFNGWNVTGNVMTQITAGVWQAALTNLPVGYHKFKITDGTNWYPLYDLWLDTDPSGNVTVTYNLNTVSDGWYGTVGRVGENVDPRRR